MASRGRWAVWLLPLVFLGLLSWAVWSRDPDFWRSTASLAHLAQEAAAQGDRARALVLARKAWSRKPKDAADALLVAQVFLEAGDPQKALEISNEVTARTPGPAAVKLQALALDALGEQTEALELLAAYLQEHPDDQAILEAAGQLAARQPDNVPLAITYYQRLYQLGQDPLVRRHLIDLLLSLNRYPEAIPLQEEEVAQFPDNRDSLHRLALCYYWQRDYRAASQIYQRLLEKAAGDAALRLEAARTAAAGQEVDRALSHYLWLYGHHQGKKEYALALARLWAQKGNHTEAEAVLAPLMQDHPDLELRRWYALELLLTGDLTRARREYHAAWVAGDTHQETIVNLARLQARQEHFSKAAAMWDEAVRRGLVHGEMRWEAALTYSYARRFADALELLAPLRQQHPKDLRLILFSGQLQFYQKHWGQAAHYFQKYLAKNPQDPEVRRLLAEALSFQPETRKDAVGAYGEVLKLHDDPALRLRRISLLLEEQRWEEAARELQNCPAPEDPRLLKEQAHLYLWLGNLPDALKYYDLSLQKSPLDRGARLDKAKVLTYLGRGREALEILNRLRMEQPNEAVVRTAAIEAYLTLPDYPKALALAQKELEPLADLKPDERALAARCYYHSADPKQMRRAAELLLTNLQQKRHHHPSLLLLAAVLPRLPRYEDLDKVMDGLPGIRVGSPEQAAALAYFDGQLGRQGGKLNYLLHVLQEYRRRSWPDSPGELLGLAWLAMEVEDRSAAAAYYRKAMELRPTDPDIPKLLLQCQMSQKNWSGALATLEQSNPGAPLEMARLYLLKSQYEGVKAAVARIPEGSPDWVPGLLLLVQAQRRARGYPAALQTLAQLEGKITRAEYLMEKARTLEAMGDKEAARLYAEIIDSQPDSPAARVARARQARAQKNWGTAYKEYALALQDAPQDVELLNELEEVRQQLRPQLASRGFPESRGERRPEEAQRPWQFSRFGREPQGLGLSNYLPQFISDVLPVVQPESLYLTDSNKLYGGIFRLGGAFWITKALPARLGLEYREYNQNTQSAGLGTLNLGLNPVFNQGITTASRLRRGELSLGLGPLSVTERLRLSGEVIFRRYWRRDDAHIVQNGLKTFTVQFPIPHFIYQNTSRTYDFTTWDDKNRFLGTLELGFSPTPKTDAALRYSRRDIFDQEGYLFPRLYQSVLNLTEAQVTTYHQVDLSYSHQFQPGLDWRGNIGGAFFSDLNRRLTLYQGLTWGAVRQPRMHLDFTPHYYLASYAHRHSAYFSPGAYHAFGLGLDFDRQIFRLPTLILQGTLQAVNQHGDWGPGLQGLAALEWEFVQNFYADAHIFYFREFVDNYRILTAGVSFRYRF